MRNALIMTTGNRIEVAHFPACLRGQESSTGGCQVGSMVSLETLERAQIEHILEVKNSREEAALIQPTRRHSQGHANYAGPQKMKRHEQLLIR